MFPFSRKSNPVIEGIVTMKQKDLVNGEHEVKIDGQWPHPFIASHFSLGLLSIIFVVLDRVLAFPGLQLIGNSRLGLALFSGQLPPKLAHSLHF